MKLTEQELTALEYIARHRDAFAIDAPSVLELVRVYRIATSSHMYECLLHGESVGPGEMLDQLFPESRQ